MLSKIHTLIVYLVFKIPKFEYRIELPASNLHLTLKIHTLIVCRSKNKYLLRR